MEGESWWVGVGMGGCVWVWVCVCVCVCVCMVCLECFINHFFQSALVAITSVVIYQTLPALDTVRLGSCLMTILYTCNAVNFKSNVIALIVHYSPISAYMHTYTVQLSFLDHRHFKQYPLHLPTHIRMAVGGGLPLRYSRDMCF